MEQLIAAFIGGLFRLAPEGIKVLRAWIENKHEIEMLKQSGIIEVNKTKYKAEIARVDASYNTSAAYDSIIKLQTRKTGNKVVDFMNATVRPYATYLLLFLYVMIKIYFMFHCVPYDLIWNPADMSLLVGVMSFWFVGRVLDRK
jgi:hypothetical protein